MSSSGRKNKSSKSNKTIKKKNKNLAAIGQQSGGAGPPPKKPPRNNILTSAPPAPPSPPPAPPLTTQIFLDLDDKPYKTIDADTKIVDIENKIILEEGKYILGMYASFHIENKKITEFGDPIVNDTIENNGIPILILTDTSLLVDSLITDYNDNVVKQRFKSATSNSPINPPKIPTTSIDDDFPDYVEEQIFPDCGVHAINNLFQCRMYKIDELSDISKYSTIDKLKKQCLNDYECITTNENLLGLRRCFGMIIESNGTFSVITKYYRSNNLQYTYIGSNGEIIKFDNHDKAFSSIKKWTNLCFVLRDYSRNYKNNYVAEMRMLKPVFDLTQTKNLQTIKDHIDTPVGYVQDPNYSELVLFLRKNNAIPDDLDKINDIGEFENAVNDMFDKTHLDPPDPPVFRKRVETRPPPQNVLDKVKAELIAVTEAEKIRLAKIEEDRLEAARLAKIESDRLAAEKAEKDRLAKIEADRIAAEKAEQDRLAKIESDRIAAEQAEKDRLAKIEADGLEAQKGKMEAELMLAQTRAEKDKLAEEIADIQKKLVKIETDRLAAEQAEKDRLEATRLAEVARLAAEQAETDRLEAARLAELARLEAERKKEQEEKDQLKIINAELIAKLANVVPGVGLASAPAPMPSAGIGLASAPAPIQHTGLGTAAPGLSNTAAPIQNTGVGSATAAPESDDALRKQLEIMNKKLEQSKLLLSNANIPYIEYFPLDEITVKLDELFKRYNDPNISDKEKAIIDNEIDVLSKSKLLNADHIEIEKKRVEDWKKEVDPIFERWYNEMKSIIPKNVKYVSKKDLQNAGFPMSLVTRIFNYRHCYRLIHMTPEQVNQIEKGGLKGCINTYDIREQVAIMKSFPKIFDSGSLDNRKENNDFKSVLESSVEKMYNKYIANTLEPRSRINPAYLVPDPNDPSKKVDFLTIANINFKDGDGNIVIAPVKSSSNAPDPNAPDPNAPDPNVQGQNAPDPNVQGQTAPGQVQAIKNTIGAVIGTTQLNAQKKLGTVAQGSVAQSISSSNPVTAPGNNAPQANNPFANATVKPSTTNSSSAQGRPANNPFGNGNLFANAKLKKIGTP